MFHSRWFGGFCLFALSLSQTSCVVDSVEPLSDPATTEVDRRLFGQWKVKELGFVFPLVPKSDTLDYIIGRPPEGSIKDCPPGLMVLHGFRRSAKDEVSGGKAGYFFVTKIGKDDYMNLINLKDDKNLVKWNREDLKSFTVVKYSVAQDRLTILLMDRSATATVIDSGKLKGKVTRPQADGPVDNVHLTDSSANLAKFLAADGSRTLFLDKGKMVMDRVK
jgi:hypothetical protein